MIRFVQPANGRPESLYLVVTMAVVIVAWCVTVLGRQRHDDQAALLDYQINGYQVLNAVEQGLYADLDAAGLEIDGFHDDNKGAWRSVEDLGAEFIAPFSHDRAWERRGRPVWSLLTTAKPSVHAAAYLGRTGDAAVAGSFVLFLEHRHDVVGEPEGLQTASKDNHFQIWYQPRADVQLPVDLSEQGLIRKNWKEIVPYSGKNERERLKGVSE